MLVKGNSPVSFNYPSSLSTGGLFVQGQVYDVTTGAAVLHSQVPMVNAGNGIYVANFLPLLDKAYLVIAVVFEDSGYTAVDPTWPPVVFSFESPTANTSLLNFNYGAYDQDDSLILGASVFDMSTGSPVLIGSPFQMTHVIYGTYFGQSTGVIGKDYQVSKLVYTDTGLTSVDASRPAGAETLQCFTLSVAPPSGNTECGAILGVVNNDPTVIGIVDNNLAVTGRLTC